MKKNKLQNTVFILFILSFLGIAGLLVRDLLRSPSDYFDLAQEYIKQKDYQTALIYLRRSAKAGLPQAQYELALWYDVGDKIPENRELALHYMQQAVANEIPEAQYALGVWIERGCIPDKNTSDAVLLYEKAGQKGHQNAIKSLISIYGLGADGVIPDFNKQTYWISQLKNKGK